MIVDLEKYLIFGSHKDMDQFFSLSQRAGFLEFIDPTRKKVLQLPEEAKISLLAIKIARHYPTHPLEAPKTDLGIGGIAEKIVSMKAEEEVFLEEERTLTAEIARIAAFGDFSRRELDELENETKRVFQFFCLKSELVSKMELSPELIHVGTEYDLDYFVAINEEGKQYPKMIEILIDQPVGALRERLFEVREEIQKLEGSIRSLSNYLPQLQAGLIEQMNVHHLKIAKHNAKLQLEDGVFAIEAWVPKTRAESLLGLIAKLNVESEKILIEKEDRIPTYMENKGVAKVGEDILHIFDTPAYTDADPSMWVLVFFALFFAMIVSDAGYGLIFLVFSLFLRFKFPKLQGAKRRMVKLGILLSSCAIFWGVITGAYFGIAFAPDSPVQKISLIRYLVKNKAEYHFKTEDDVYRDLVKKYPSIKEMRKGEDMAFNVTKEVGKRKTYPVFDEFSSNILLEFSFIVGIIHLSLSFLRYLRRNWSGIGWVFFMIGGYLYFPSIIHATTLVNFMEWISKPVAYFIGIRLLFGGIALAFVLALIRRKWGAFQELLHTMQVFADTLSYLRLYALALGGMVMAHTFNDALGIDPGVVATFFIVIFGHATNIMIALMGSVVHGLRLNFLEWFHYSFEGGGRLFNPLRLNKTK